MHTYLSKDANQPLEDLCVLHVDFINLSIMMV